MDTEKNQDKPSAQPKSIPEGLLIFSAPVAAYVLTLSYIMGYAEFFRIPIDFISVNFATLFAVLSGELWIWASLLYLLFMVVFVAVPYSDHRFLELAIKFLFPLAAILFVQVLLGAPWPERVPVLAFLLFMAIYALVTPLFLKGVSYSEKMRTWLEPIPFETVVSRYSRKTLIRTAVTIIFWANTGSYVSYCVGRVTAQRHKEFLVLGSSPDAVVLISFGDNLVIAPFDRKTKQVERSFSVLKKAEDPKLVLRWEVVGPLQLRPRSTTAPQPAATSSPSPTKP